MAAPNPRLADLSDDDRQVARVVAGRVRSALGRGHPRQPRRADPARQLLAPAGPGRDGQDRPRAAMAARPPGQPRIVPQGVPRAGQPRRRLRRPDPGRVRGPPPVRRPGRPRRLPPPLPAPGRRARPADRPGRLVALAPLVSPESRTAAENARGTPRTVRPVPDHQAAGPGGDGLGLPGRGHPARPPRGPEGPRLRDPRRPRGAEAVPGRGPHRRHARPPLPLPGL